MGCSTSCLDSRPLKKIHQDISQGQIHVETDLIPLQKETNMQKQIILGLETQLALQKKEIDTLRINKSTLLESVHSVKQKLAASETLLEHTSQKLTASETLLEQTIEKLTASEILLEQTSQKLTASETLLEHTSEKLTASETLLSQQKLETKLDWSALTFDNSVEYSLEHQTFDARVVDIYDGDTITLVIGIPQPYRFNIRLSDIDTCEMKSHEPGAKQLAMAARNRLCELITDVNPKELKRKEVRKILNDRVFMVEIRCGKFDKYGRLLGWIHKHNQCLNQVLLQEKYAYPYQGQTKLTEAEQIQSLMEC